MPTTFHHHAFVCPSNIPIMSNVPPNINNSSHIPPRLNDTHAMQPYPIHQRLPSVLSQCFVLIPTDGVPIHTFLALKFWCAQLMPSIPEGRRRKKHKSHLCQNEANVPCDEKKGSQKTPDVVCDATRWWGWDYAKVFVFLAPSLFSTLARKRYNVLLVGAWIHVHLEEHSWLPAKPRRAQQARRGQQPET